MLYSRIEYLINLIKTTKHPELLVLDFDKSGIVQKLFLRINKCTDTIHSNWILNILTQTKKKPELLLLDFDKRGISKTSKIYHSITLEKHWYYSLKSNT